jgi:hypothetical protein
MCPTFSQPSPSTRQFICPGVYPDAFGWGIPDDSAEPSEANNRPADSQDINKRHVLDYLKHLKPTGKDSILCRNGARMARTKLTGKVLKFFQKSGSEGGKMRAKKYSREQLSAWGKKGGRPPKKK